MRSVAFFEMTQGKRCSATSLEGPGVPRPSSRATGSLLLDPQGQPRSQSAVSSASCGGRDVLGPGDTPRQSTSFQLSMSRCPWCTCSPAPCPGVRGDGCQASLSHHLATRLLPCSPSLFPSILPTSVTPVLKPRREMTLTLLHFVAVRPAIHRPCGHVLLQFRSSCVSEARFPQPRCPSVVAHGQSVVRACGVQPFRGVSDTCYHRGGPGGHRAQ